MTVANTSIESYQFELSQPLRPYTISMLERALKDVHFATDPKRSAKQQALEARLNL